MMLTKTELTFDDLYLLRLAVRKKIECLERSISEYTKYVEERGSELSANFISDYEEDLLEYRSLYNKLRQLQREL